MKKIVGIVSVLALASALFADAPAFNAAVTKYDASAAIQYKIDLDAETMGIVNQADLNATVEVSAWGAGSKATSGDGLWGELEIGGDATGTYNGPAATIKKANIHFVDGDFSVVADILKPNLEVGGGDLDSAVKSTILGLPKSSVALANAAGFNVAIGVADVANFNVSFADNGVVKADAKKFAVKADATLKAVENLDAYAGVAWSQEEDDVAIAARAGYRVDIDDGLFVKPSVGYAMKGDAKELGAQVLLAWGAVGQEPNFMKVGATPAVENKTANGVSATVKSSDLKTFTIIAGAYDATLVEGLKAGVQVETSTAKDAATAIGVAAAYGTAIDIWNLSCEAGAKINIADETKMGFAYKAGVNTDGIIQNTTLSCDYEGAHAADVGGANLKGTITFGAKIHF